MATQWGVGPVAQGPQHGKKHISIERMSCSAGVIAPQSRNLWPLTSAKVCIYWDTDLCCSAPRSRRRRLGMNKEGGKALAAVIKSSVPINIQRKAEESRCAGERHRWLCDKITIHHILTKLKGKSHLSAIKSISKWFVWIVSSGTATLACDTELTRNNRFSHLNT